jgi:hypothetical protein
VNHVNQTGFPATPRDVAALTVQEFTFDLDELDGNEPPSMERVCRTFMDDTNRALIWWIRFGALKAWCARTDVIARLAANSLTLRDACPLNDRWEFDAKGFGSAIDSVTVRRARASAG